ncbi:hypothetical protein ONE63_004074 [Megalurothrips usitatus]|uniref:VIT domain-containing protein n=1 Tax=Megalurothrips usitatus TaxID=439358 RepID=A0AAV7X4U9_9NEOP|nr:hypothetical protein ONE63_004074 [Megalurothrips usitatus]
MRFHAALVLAALAAACHCAQGNSPVIGLSGDNTRHGVVVLHGDFKATQEVVVTRYHVDTLIQTRFARSVIEVEVQNNADAARQIVIPFAIPATAMLTSFEIESDGEKHQARAVLKDSIQVDSTSTSATIKARNAEAFDVDVELASGGSALLRIEYEELLTRHLQRYKTVQQVWPGSVSGLGRVPVANVEERPLLTPASRTSTANNNIVTVNATRTVKVSKVQQAQGLAEVTITLQPSVSEQRELARQLGLDPERGLAGQLNVDYDVERYPTAGDIVVRNGHFAHFFAPSDLNSTSALPKYALFLLDTSGSMGGTKIQQLRDAMKTIIAQLAPQDYFTIINFSDSNNVSHEPTASCTK